MADYETLEKLIADLGEPALMLDSKDYKTPERRRYEDVCDSYAIYFHESASGGCIAYGKTNYGWVVNPSLRFPVCALMKMVLESKEREVKAFSDKHESSFSKIARKQHKDDNECN